MGDCIKISKKFNGKLLTKYHGMGFEGLCYFDVYAGLQERIQTMHALAVVGSPYIDSFCSITSYLPDEIDCAFIIPNQEPQFLSDDNDFVNSFHKGKQFWCLEKFESNKIKSESKIHMEVLTIEVSHDGFFWLTGCPYENNYFLSRIFTNKIKLSEIGL